MLINLSSGTQTRPVEAPRAVLASAEVATSNATGRRLHIRPGGDAVHRAVNTVSAVSRTAPDH